MSSYKPACCLPSVLHSFFIALFIHSLSHFTPLFPLPPVLLILFSPPPHFNGNERWNMSSHIIRLYKDENIFSSLQETSLPYVIPEKKLLRFLDGFFTLFQSSSCRKQQHNNNNKMYAHLYKQISDLK